MPEPGHSSGVFFEGVELPTPDLAVLLVRQTCRGGNFPVREQVNVVLPDGMEIGSGTLFSALIDFMAKPMGLKLASPPALVDILYDAGYALVNRGGPVAEQMSLKEDVRRYLGQSGVVFSKAGIVAKPSTPVIVPSRASSETAVALPVQPALKRDPREEGMGLPPPPEAVPLIHQALRKGYKPVRETVCVVLPDGAEFGSGFVFLALTGYKGRLPGASSLASMADIIDRLYEAGYTLVSRGANVSVAWCNNDKVRKGLETLNLPFNKAGSLEHLSAAQQSSGNLTTSAYPSSAKSRPLSGADRAIARTVPVQSTPAQGRSQAASALVSGQQEEREVFANRVAMPTPEQALNLVKRARRPLGREQVNVILPDGTEVGSGELFFLITDFGTRSKNAKQALPPSIIDWLYEAGYTLINRGGPLSAQFSDNPEVRRYLGVNGRPFARAGAEPQTPAPHRVEGTQTSSPTAKPSEVRTRTPSPSSSASPTPVAKSLLQVAHPASPPSTLPQNHGSGIFFEGRELPTPEQAVTVVKKSARGGELLLPGRIDAILPDGTQLGCGPLIYMLTGIRPFKADGKRTYKPPHAIEKLYDAGYVLINYGSSSVKSCRPEVRNKLATLGAAISRAERRPALPAASKTSGPIPGRPTHTKAREETHDMASPPAIADRLPHTQDYESFFYGLETLLSGQIQLFTPRFESQQNALRIPVPHLHGCHYEICLERSYHEIGLYFEARVKLNERRLQAFQPYLDQISRQLHYAVEAERWKQTWSRVRIKLPAEALTDALTEDYADLVQSFIAETYPILQSAKASVARHPRMRHVVTRVERPAPQVNQPAILDSEIKVIRAYLEGHSEQRPSSDKLCDWVLFCYTFELFDEAQQLFRLVASQEVNGWYYDRTKRFAKISALKVLPDSDSIPNVEILLKIGQQEYTLSRELVFAAVRQAVVQQGLPPEAKDFSRQALEIGGKRLNASWVLSLVTGMPQSVFQKAYAVLILHERLGFAVVSSPDGTATSPVAEGMDRRLEILSSLFKEISSYLTGLAQHHPSDEKLCDWIYFCNSFEQFGEAAELFARLSPMADNRWYYERTRHLVEQCKQGTTRPQKPGRKPGYLARRRRQWA